MDQPPRAQQSNGAPADLPIDDWGRLDRFLLYGDEEGAYRAGEPEPSREQAPATLRCLAADGARTVGRIAEVAESGRAPRAEPVLFALALAAAEGDDAARRLALSFLPRVCRTGSQLLRFASFVSGMRGWGRGLREAVRRWYEGRPERELALEALVCRETHGWTHRDLLRLAHPRPDTEARRILYHWLTQGWPGVGVEPHDEEALRPVWAHERAHVARWPEEVAALIRDHDVPLAAVPIRWLTERAVWEALLPGLSPAELIDSLARLSAAGVLDDPDTVERVARAVADERRLRAARVHPLGLLAAFTRYAAGEEGAGEGRLAWTPARRILDALEAGFYAPFSVAEEAGRRWVIGLDVSEELARGGVAGVPGLTPRAAVAAMALVTAAVGAECHTVALGPDGPWELPITPRQRLNDVLEAMRALPPVAAVDCAQPVRWALERGVAADAFVVCCGGDRIVRGGPDRAADALRRYRAETGIPARLIVWGMTAAERPDVTDPSDAGMLEVVGFDLSAPGVIADFAR